MGSFKFTVVISGDGVDLTEEQKSEVSRAIIEAGTSHLGKVGVELPSVPQVVGPVVVDPGEWRLHIGIPAFEMIEVADRFEG